MNKTAFISGASRGIGRAIAKELASLGYNLYLTCQKNEELLNHVKEELAAAYSIECHCYTGDMASFEFVSNIFAQIPQLDVVVNNAGISHIGLLTDMSVEEWHRVLDTNLSSVFYVCKLASEKMLKAHQGKIINISSVGGLVPDISQVAYGTSKAAINYLTKLIAVQEARHHIRCNAVLPGMTATEAVEKHLSDDFRNLFLRHIPLGRMGLPEEIAEAVCYFASDASAYTTGQILTVSGGFGLATPVYGDLIAKRSKR